LPLRDVAFDEPSWDVGTWAEYQRGLKLDSPEWMRMQRPGYQGALTYTHKVKDGKDIYFFANSSEKDVKAGVRLRGSKKLKLWDPHNGEVREVIWKNRKKEGTTLTEFDLILPAAYSLFLMAD
jgi:hypothetical protein